MSKWQQHKERWKDCQACKLCEQRQRVVLFKGAMPCDVLLVGEAPGVSEDVVGKPFVGPAGHLLAEIVDEALYHASNGDCVRLGYTNLVACVPLEEDGGKAREPDKDSIKKCAPRLAEIVAFCNPKKIVAVGKLSTKHLERYDYEIVHPAAILRADVSQKGLAIQRCIVTLTECFESLIPF